MKRGFTLMEFLVALTVLAVITTITFVGLRAWRGQSLRVECMQKLGRVHQALMLYRTEWGNPSEVVGSTTYLGLPVHKHEEYYSLYPWEVPQFGRTEKERYEIFTCPVLLRQIDFYVNYGYLPAGQFADEERGIFPYSSATAVLQGATPVVYCLDHYGPKTVWRDRAETYPMVVLSLDGRVFLEYITGLLLNKNETNPYFDDPTEEILYIRQRNPEAFDREMKLLQERRQSRR